MTEHYNNAVDKNTVFFISLMMSVLQTLEECDAVKYVSQKSCELDSLHNPINLYPIKAENVEVGMMLWDLTGRTPQVIDIVERVLTFDYMTEIYYLSKGSHVVDSKSMMFSCCRSNLLLTRYNKLDSRQHMYRSLLEDPKNKDLKSQEYS